MLRRVLLEEAESLGGRDRTTRHSLLDNGSGSIKDVSSRNISTTLTTVKTIRIYPLSFAYLAKKNQTYNFQSNFIKNFLKVNFIFSSACS